MRHTKSCNLVPVDGGLYLTQKPDKKAYRTKRQKAMMELGACAILLEKCATPWAMTACNRYRPRWHASPGSQAEVTVRPFPWLQRVTLIFLRVCEYAVCVSLGAFFVFPRRDHKHRETMLQ